MNKKIVYIFSGVFFVGIVFFIIGIVTSLGIKVNYHEIDNGYAIKLSQITDTHFDDDFKRETYLKMIETINDSDIDVLMFTGDLFQVDEVSDALETDIISILSELEATNKIAVLGNHDYYHGDDFTEQVIRILESSGFTVLINEGIELIINEQTFHFYGLDDYMMGDTNYSVVLDEIDENAINFVLSHEPDTFDVVLDQNIEAMFSGHSHGGQIRLPIIGDIYNVPGAKKYNEHQYVIDDKTLFISFGLGESMIRFRFYNHRQFEIYNYS